MNVRPDISASSTTLKFRRGFKDLRDFEVNALNAVPGIGSYYPDPTSLGVEAQMLRDGPVSENTISVFFRLNSYDGFQGIEIQDPLLPSVYSNKGYIWSSSDGKANATILEEYANGRKVIESLIDGVKVRFEADPETGYYWPVEGAARQTARMFAQRRTDAKAA